MGQQSPGCIESGSGSPTQTMNIVVNPGGKQKGSIFFKIHRSSGDIPLDTYRIDFSAGKYLSPDLVT